MNDKTIKEIKDLLFNEKLSKAEIKHLMTDERKGVKVLIQKWNSDQRVIEQEKQEYDRMCQYEHMAVKQGYRLIAGIDEVGRGPLAGPVVAAAVILKDSFYLPGLNDSKKLSEQKRELFYEYILNNALVGIAFVSSKTIDEINIYQASKLAMQDAVKKLTSLPDFLLIDALNLPLPIAQKSIIKGDANSVSIAAASVVAKVTRDRYMRKLGEKYPEYGFENHMGYGTKQHLDAITNLGITDEHRTTFGPVKGQKVNV